MPRHNSTEKQSLFPRKGCAFVIDKSTGNVTLHPMPRHSSAEKQSLFPRKGCAFVIDKSTGNVTLHPMPRHSSAEKQSLFPRKGCVFVIDKSTVFTLRKNCKNEKAQDYLYLVFFYLQHNSALNTATTFLFCSCSLPFFASMGNQTIENLFVGNLFLGKR